MIKLIDILNENNPCWKGYKQIGMKEKDGKEVPNCVPIEEGEDDEIDEYDVENEQDFLLYWNFFSFHFF